MALDEGTCKLEAGVATLDLFLAISVCSLSKRSLDANKTLE